MHDELGALRALGTHYGPQLLRLALAQPRRGVIPSAITHLFVRTFCSGRADREHTDGLMTFPTRLGSTVLLCASLTACAALLPAVVVPQLVATLGVAGVSAVACAKDPSCDAQASRCVDSAGRNIEVTESSDFGVPTDEGKVAAFMPAYWQSQFVAQGTSRAEHPVEATAGTFVITDKSAMFVPPPGMEGVRIPLAGVINVETQLSSTTGAARQMTVESCFGRLDRITFGQRQQADRLDSEATAAAAAEIKVRVVAAHAAANKRTTSPPSSSGAAGTL